ncbi:thioredoxin family protein [Gilvimarinus agarilyticus]|uniref:thioredoxin family protein n=1 Tax=unclassified Gilvimarinus TaxID=2642066 RepID=UPI001C09B8C0|nr:MULTISPECIES: thioredoxin family protein [unclassified Gilvimarinus]MBU2886257.1 thioredoxin family protein [Gilvimarinus agarilyticus]MDO6570945.1 thioredoxin family protein [Gilvimarinus sp. 2_MG-2023]MDO6747768.1 thioredoxin family protein [Gilvimarinus sp. 1_MG-2023]
MLSFTRLACASLLLWFSAGVLAVDAEPFTKERFDSLQAEGTPILVDIYATWCPTCAKQRKLLEAYQTQNPDTDLVILEVDFDDQKQWVTHFKAPRQSTLVLFNNGEQVWFSVAETREEKLYAALNKVTETAE